MICGAYEEATATWLRDQNRLRYWRKRRASSQISTAFGSSPHYTGTLSRPSASSRFGTAIEQADIPLVVYEAMPLLSVAAIAFDLVGKFLDVISETSCLRTSSDLFFYSGRLF